MTMFLWVFSAVIKGLLGTFIFMLLPVTAMAWDYRKEAKRIERRERTEKEHR